MDIDHNRAPASFGKVLLYTTRDEDAPPAMAIKHKTTSNLPTILKELSLKYSPIQSKLFI